MLAISLLPNTRPPHAFARANPKPGQTGARAAIGPLGNARVGMALWTPVLGAVRANPWLRAFYERLRAAGKPPKLTLVAAMRNLLHTASSVASTAHHSEFRMPTEQARAE
jgi:hypothetical protein